MEEQDKRYLKVSLDDAIVKAANADGSEKLRLSEKVSGHEVLIRFPAYGDWDFYVRDLAKLMIMLAQTAQDIELDIDLVPEKYFPQWSYVVAQTIQYKECKELIEKIFFTYLRPEVPTLKDENVQVDQWLRENMDISHLFYMFTSILHIEDWLKKKSGQIIRTTFPNLMQLSSKDTSQKNSTFQSKNCEPGRSYKFD